MLLLLLSSLSLYLSNIFWQLGGRKLPIISESIWKLKKSLVPFWDFAYDIRGAFWWLQCITLPVIVFLIAWLVSYVHCLFSHFRRLKFFCLFLSPLLIFSSFKKKSLLFWISNVLEITWIWAGQKRPSADAYLSACSHWSTRVASRQCVLYLCK